MEGGRRWVGESGASSVTRKRGRGGGWGGGRGGEREILVSLVLISSLIVLHLGSALFYKQL